MSRNSERQLNSIYLLEHYENVSAESNRDYKNAGESYKRMIQGIDRGKELF